MKDTFKFSVYSQNGLVCSVDIPQSCMEWKKVKQNNTTYVVPDKLDETGQALRSSCMQKAEVVVKQHAYDFEQYKVSTQNYFDKQRRMFNERLKKNTTP